MRILARNEIISKMNGFPPQTISYIMSVSQGRRV
jgi:hypothetical protein